MATKRKSLDTLAKAKSSGSSKPAAPAPTPENRAVFESLKGILKRQVPPLQVLSEKPDSINVHSRVLGPDGKPYWFGGAAFRKGRVSFYLFPVYVEPQLLEGVSPGLRKQMEGRSCFNFSRVEPNLLKELESLTAKGVARWKKGGVV